MAKHEAFIEAKRLADKQVEILRQAVERRTAQQAVAPKVVVTTVDPKKR